MCFRSISFKALDPRLHKPKTKQAYRQFQRWFTCQKHIKGLSAENHVQGFSFAGDILTALGMVTLQPTLSCMISFWSTM